VADQTTGPQEVPEGQSGRQVRLRIDERKLETNYANGFRTQPTAEEVVLDFGLNLAAPPQQQSEGGQASGVSGEMVFQINDRVVMNYYTAKRLAISLSQVVRRHEERFGEVKLNVADRVQGDGQQG